MTQVLTDPFALSVSWNLCRWGLRQLAEDTQALLPIVLAAGLTAHGVGAIAFDFPSTPSVEAIVARNFTAGVKDRAELEQQPKGVGGMCFVGKGSEREPQQLKKGGKDGRKQQAVKRREGSGENQPQPRMCWWRRCMPW